MLLFHSEFPGGKFIDCDLSLPTIPSSTRYDGSPSDAATYLQKMKPKGWLEELGKLQDMGGEAGAFQLIDQTEFQVRFRHISPGVILPQQVR